MFKQDDHGPHRSPEKKFRSRNIFAYHNIDYVKKNYYLLFENYMALVMWKKPLSPHHPRMLCAKFGWNWSNGSVEGDFLIFVLSLLSSLGKSVHLNKLEFPFTHGWFLPSLIEIRWVVQEKEIVKLKWMCFDYRGPSFEKKNLSERLQQQRRIPGFGSGKIKMKSL